MHSKRSLEGYLLIDNSHAPGPSDEEIAKFGKDVLGARGKLELPIVTCSHCHRQVAMQPGRTRERPYCRKCDHYICDDCAVVATIRGECVTMNEVLDSLQERSVLIHPRG